MWSVVFAQVRHARRGSAGRGPDDAKQRTPRAARYGRAKPRRFSPRPFPDGDGRPDQVDPSTATAVWSGVLGTQFRRRSRGSVTGAITHAQGILECNCLIESPAVIVNRHRSRNGGEPEIP